MTQEEVSRRAFAILSREMAKATPFIKQLLTTDDATGLLIRHKLHDEEPPTRKTP